MTRQLSRAFIFVFFATTYAGVVPPKTTYADDSAPAATQPSATVQINDFNFEPRELTVPVGATVTWINHDDVPHTATARGDSPLFDSKALDTDDKYSFTFTKAGEYPYYCKVHTHMTGKIIVK